MSSGVYLSVKRELEKGKKAVVITFLVGDENSCHKVENQLVFTGEQLYASRMHGLDADTAIQARLALETGKLLYLKTSSAESVLIEPYFPRPQLIILGGGDIAKPLAELGTKSGFLTTVVDDRPMYANRDRFPFAGKVICDTFESFLMQFPLNEYSFVVVVTREHRHDVECLRQVLKYNTAYSGMIGSLRSVNFVKEQLAIAGCAEEAIKKLNAPIGLDIGAVTFEEIAISIMAQIIQYRRSSILVDDEKVIDRYQRSNWPEADTAVLEELCKNTGEPRALVTVIDTQGPAPRKPGTKMLVWSYGMTEGSIGGGYAEGEVINAAWQIIGTGGLKIHDIDLTGQTAEEEGLVCGGIMRVLIEDIS